MKTNNTPGGGGVEPIAQVVITLYDNGSVSLNVPTGPQEMALPLLVLALFPQAQLSTRAFTQQMGKSVIVVPTTKEAPTHE